MWKITPVLLSSLFLTFSAHASSPAEKVLFGPKSYTRTTGAPNVYTDHFASTFGDATLVVKAGDGKISRISAAIVKVNGTSILKPDDFSKAIDIIELPLYDLTIDTTISVELRGTPGSSLNVQVVKKILEPGQVLSKLGSDLKKNDIKAALTAFVPSPKTEIIMRLDQQSLIQLGELVSSAQLVESKEHYQVYRSEIIDDDGVHHPEIMLYRNDLGVWKINSW